MPEALRLVSIITLCTLKRRKQKLAKRDAADLQPGQDNRKTTANIIGSLSKIKPVINVHIGKHRP